MAATQFNTTEAAAVLKEFYLPPIRKQINQATPFLAEVERDSEHVEGKRAYVPLHVQRSEGIGARGETGSLPTARSQKYKEATFNVKYLYGRIELTLPVMKATASDRGSFLRAVESETDGIMRELKEDVDRQLITNDAAGRGTLVATGITTASTTVNVSGADATTRLKLRKGMFIDIIDNDDDTAITNGTNREVTAVTNDVNGVTTSFAIADGGGNVTTDATQRVVRTGNWKNELNGLSGIVSDTGTLQGVDPASFDVWKSSVVDAAGALSEPLMQQIIDKVAIESGEEPDAIVTEHTQRRKFYGLLTSMKRAVNTLQLKGGFTTLTFNDNVPLLLDRFCDPTRMYFINRKHLKIYEMADWDWADMDGAVLSRVSGKPAFEAFLYKYAELGTDRRNAHGLLKGLTT